LTFLAGVALWRPDVTISTSAIFELNEWGAAEIFGDELGAAYLGIRETGHVWDAHRDTALASAGALIAMLTILHIDVYSRVQPSVETGIIDRKYF
jgi:uncharacterized membrane protein YjdF